MIIFLSSCTKVMCGTVSCAVCRLPHGLKMSNGEYTCEFNDHFQLHITSYPYLQCPVIRFPTWSIIACKLYSRGTTDSGATHVERFSLYRYCVRIAIIILSL